MKKLKKLSVKELIIYIVSCGFVLWGLTYIILGLLAKYLPIPDAHNQIKIADNTIRSLFGLGYLGWGLILFGSFALVGAIAMMVFAKGVDKDFEKNQRRQARLQRNKVEETPQESIVDAEVK